MNNSFSRERMTRNEAANTVFNGAFIGFVILIAIVAANAFVLAVMP